MTAVCYKSCYNILINIEHNRTDTMQSKQLKSFLESHPKLMEYAFAGTIAVGTIGAETMTIAANNGP